MSLCYLVCCSYHITEDRITQNQLHHKLRHYMLKYNMITRCTTVTTVVDTHPEAGRLDALVFKPSKELISHDLWVDGVKLGEDSDAHTTPARKRKWREFSSDDDNDASSSSETDSLDATTIELGQTPPKRSRCKGIMSPGHFGSPVCK